MRLQRKPPFDPKLKAAIEVAEQRTCRNCIYLVGWQQKCGSLKSIHYNTQRKPNQTCLRFKEKKRD